MPRFWRDIDIHFPGSGFMSTHLARAFGVACWFMALTLYAAMPEDPDLPPPEAFFCAPAVVAEVYVQKVPDVEYKKISSN